MNKVIKSSALKIAYLLYTKLTSNCIIYIRIEAAQLIDETGSVISKRPSEKG
jgi:hypothetical protein